MSVWKFFFPHNHSPPRKFFFLHNPKAGGASIRVLLQSVSKGGAIAPQFMNAPEDYRSNRGLISTLRGYDLYFGHYGYEVFQVVNDGHTLVTNFRDPAQRVHSMYRYWRHNVLDILLDQLTGIDAYVVRLAKEMSFSEFIRVNDEDLLCYISNFHFRQIYMTGWSHYPYTHSAELIVYRRINDMPWFFITETPEVSMSLFRLTFPGVSDIDMPIENVSLGNRDEISQKDVEHLISLNRFDYDIHAYAMRIQSERLANQDVFKFKADKS
jgi:hypothetical protein